LLLGSTSAHAEATYISGHISDVTFIRDAVYLRVDAGLPGNCSATSYGWIRVPPENKPISSFILALWARGDAASVVVTVYTDAVDGTGYCSVNQLDPAG